MTVSAGGQHRSAFVAATVNRLRMVLVDFADDSNQTREECLDDVIERSLGEIVPDQRRAFLQDLMERFPAWDARVDVALKKADTVDRSDTDDRELQDPNFLVARLIQLAPSLSDRDRQVLVERLREAGLSSENVDAWPQQERAKLRQMLQLKDESPLELSRALELVCLLGDFASRLDQLVWNTWRAIHPRSARRRAHRLREQMGELIRADADVSRGQVKDDLDRLGGLIAAITSAVRQAGRHASQYIARLSPAEVEHMAEMEGGGFLVGKEVKCWRKYVELSNALSEDIIESEIREAIARHVESLMKGR